MFKGGFFNRLFGFIQAKEAIDDRKKQKYGRNDIEIDILEFGKRDHEYSQQRTRP